LVRAIKARQAELSMAASPFLSPYVLLHSWAGAVVSLAGSTLEMGAAVVGLWILVILRSLQMFG
jgi:hypothetical protein